MHETLFKEYLLQFIAIFIQFIANTPIPEKTGSCTETRLNSPRGIRQSNMANEEEK